MAKDLIKYNPSVAWFTMAESIVQLTRATVEDVATFRVKVKPIDTNNIGQGQKAINYTFTDNIGVPYKIIAVDTDTIDVSDEFRQGCPVGGKVGIVHKSAYKGYSIHLPSELLYRLHPIAASNNNKFAMSILWGNDPNPYKIEFTNTNTPKIENYQTLRLDGYNFAEDFGEMPKIQLFTLDSVGVYWQRQEVPVWNYIGGLLDSIVFDLSDSFSGYIIISR